MGDIEPVMTDDLDHGNEGMSDTNIEWADVTWNPLAGCSEESLGCRNCYARRMAHRLTAMGAAGYERGDNAVVRDGRWTGVVHTLPDRLDEPLRWHKPRRVFVCSMSDLFHPSVPFAFVDQVFAVMALCQQHTFLVLTKRPARMAEYLRSAIDHDNLQEEMDALTLRVEGEPFAYRQIHDPGQWPLPNVWLGTSVEDQQRADERIPRLLNCPAARRFLSMEPLLGPVDLTDIGWVGRLSQHRGPRASVCELNCLSEYGISWVIIGGESGPGARPCNLDWIRRVVKQCKAAGVPVFVKQLGANCYDEANGIAGHATKWPYDILPSGPALRIRDRKGGDMSEWPADLRVREWPQQGVQS